MRILHTKRRTLVTIENPVAFGVENHGVGGEHKRKREIEGLEAKPPKNVLQVSTCNSLRTYGTHSTKIRHPLFPSSIGVIAHRTQHASIDPLRNRLKLR